MSMDEERFDQLYNRILDGENWDYSTLDELICLSESGAHEKGKEEMKKKAIEAFNTAMIFYTSVACTKEEEALKLFIKELANN